MRYKNPFRAHLFLTFLFPCIQVSAQLPVHQEPRHKVVFENEYIRVLDGHLPAHDTTLAHIHAAQSVVVFLYKPSFGIQLFGEKPVISEVNPGDTRYLPYGEKPVNHRVWNESKSVFHFMVVELVRKSQGKDTCTLQTQPEVKLILQQKL